MDINYSQSYYKIIKKKSPWITNYKNAKSRCNNPKEKTYKYYGGKGIKFLLTQKQCEILWFRDKAWELKQPSIDRLNSNKNYTFNNCRFIEHSQNSSTHLFKTVLQFDLYGNFIKKWESPIIVKKILGFDNSWINKCAKSGKPAYNYIWKYGS